MRICSGPGCLRVVADDVRFCDECKADRPPEALRLTSLERARLDPIQAEYITTAWKRLRLVILAKQPYCAGFDNVPCDALAKVVDHNIPARLIVKVCRTLGLFGFSRWPGFYVASNLIGLCHSCHNRKTRVEDTMDWTAQLVTILLTYKPSADSDSEWTAKVLKAAAS